MFLSKYFLPTQKTTPSDATIVSHQLMLKAGMIKQLTSGIYEWLPFGLKVLQNISLIIREEMNGTGSLEVLLPSIQPTSLWERSGRFGNQSDMSAEMLLMKDRHDQQLLFSPTAEEAMCYLFQNSVQSYKQLPMILYQISWKFRDEIRPRYGVMRGREFLMKDAYSFDINEQEALKSYNKMLLAYLRAYARMGLDVIPVTASSGDIGGTYSHELHVLAKTGESTIYYEQALQNAVKSPDFNLQSLENFHAMDSEKYIPSKYINKDLLTSSSIEVGHLFYLGEKYSAAMGLKVQGQQGTNIIPQMGCYGIGVSRLIGAIIETHHDDNGIIWPLNVSPFTCIIANLNVDDSECNQLALDMYKLLLGNDIDVLYDDTNDSAGSKFARMDLIGIPIQIVISKHTKINKMYEFRLRNDKNNSTKCTQEEVLYNINMLLKNVII